MRIVDYLIARIPESLQIELRRLKYALEIRADRFSTTEPEYRILDSLVKDGDWVLDVGANVGHYTKRLSELVGPSGRVLAFEPIPSTFSILAGNAQRFRHRNVTLFNLAISDRADLVGMSVPVSLDGAANYYRAHITEDSSAGPTVLACVLDEMRIVKRVALIKVDAEGHERSVLGGMLRLIARDKPTLIVETDKPDVIALIKSMGYTTRRLASSPNVLFEYVGSNVQHVA